MRHKLRSGPFKMMMGGGEREVWKISKPQRIFFYCVLVYTDDLKLLAPSLTALQYMVDTCKRFGDKNGLFFNSKKTICITFHESAKCSPIVQYPITLSGKQLKWFSSVKHLGHIFD